MGDVLRPLPLGDLHLPAGDAGPGDGGAQQVAVLVYCVGLDRGPDELLHKLLAQVLDEDLGRSSPSSPSLHSINPYCKLLSNWL